jgi:hypothetical protein
MYIYIIVHRAEYASTGHAADLNNIQARAGIEMYLDLLVFTCTELTELLL